MLNTLGFLRSLVPALFALLFACFVRAEELVIPGSGKAEYVLGQLAKAFNERQSQYRVIVPPSTGTAGALRDVGEGIASLGRVGRPLKDDEARQGFVHVPLGRDPVAVVGGADVGVRNITSAQVVDIYSGKIRNWSELGGKSAPIRAIGRETSDASRQALGMAIKPFKDLILDAAVKVVHLDPQLIDLLDQYPTSLGFLNRSGLGACRSRVVQLALDGVDPTPANLEKGLYPAWVELGLVHKPGGLSAAGRAFLDFVRSADGVRVLRRQGILPAVGGH